MSKKEPLYEFVPQKDMTAWEYHQIVSKQWNTPMLVRGLSQYPEECHRHFELAEKICDTCAGTGLLTVWLSPNDPDYAMDRTHYITTCNDCGGNKHNT